jgi:protein-S-isoprenylcysteine O-methyltransferase Ste14
MRIKWKNIPIPEGHVIPLILGIFAQESRSFPLIHIGWLSYALGIAFTLIGIVLAAWSFHEVRLIEVEAPTKLITTGPYAITRNPMYVAWHLIYVGVMFLVNTKWLLLLFSFVLAYTHYLVILREERELKGQFGNEYLEYCKKVGRYYLV